MFINDMYGFTSKDVSAMTLRSIVELYVKNHGNMITIDEALNVVDDGTYWANYYRKTNFGNGILKVEPFELPKDTNYTSNALIKRVEEHMDKKVFGYLPVLCTGVYKCHSLTAVKEYCLAIHRMLTNKYLFHYTTGSIIFRVIKNDTSGLTTFVPIVCLDHLRFDVLSDIIKIGDCTGYGGKKAPDITNAKYIVDGGSEEKKEDGSKRESNDEKSNLSKEIDQLAARLVSARELNERNSIYMSIVSDPLLPNLYKEMLLDKEKK